MTAYMAAVVLHRRSCRLKHSLSEVPHSVVYQRMGSLCVSHGAGKQRIAIGIISVIPAQRGGDVLANCLVQLDATVDGGFLVPNDAALDVEVLVRERGLSAHQRGKLPDQELRGLSHRFSPRRSEQAHTNCSRYSEHWGTASEGRKEYAPAWIPLEISVRFLNEDLTVAQGGLPIIVTRDMIALHHAKASDYAVGCNLAQGTGIEHSRG